MKFLKNNKILFSGLCIVFIGVVVSFGIVLRSTAQSPNIFGGLVTSVIPCTCSNAFLVTVSPPVPGQFVYQIGTPQFAWGNITRPGVWTLGVYNPGGVCLVYVGKGCSPFGAPIGTITPIVGTSL